MSWIAHTYLPCLYAQDYEERERLEEWQARELFGEHVEEPLTDEDIDAHYADWLKRQNTDARGERAVEERD